MSCCDVPGLLPLEQALAKLENTVIAVHETETISLENALNRVVAQDIISANNIPNYDNSAMDGYALDLDNCDVNKPLQIIGQSFAGQPFEGSLNANQCIRIMTGAKLPASCNSVVMQENTQRSNDQITLTTAIKKGDHIRLAGNDVQQGDLILGAGRRLGPTEIGMLASVGTAQITVYRKPRVAVFSTGDELVPLGTPLRSGQIYDSNRYLLRAALQQQNLEIQDYGALADDPASIEKTFIDAASRCDAVISSGGVSVGEADFTRDILHKLGEISFYKLAVKPGKPFAFGKLHKQAGNKFCYFFGLPGNPVSAAVTFHQLTLPALKKLAGEALTPTLHFSVKTRSPFKKRPGRVDFQRARLVEDADGHMGVESTGTQSSGALSSMVAANCYVRLEADRGNVAVGESVDVVLLDSLR